jgi:hypothetical protein
MKFVKGMSDEAVLRLKKASKVSQYSVTEDTVTFDELQGRAQDKALSWFAETTSQDNYWSEYVIEDAKENAPPGFKVEEIFFSGFWSQGDGASWKGYVELTEWCKNDGYELGIELVNLGAIEDTAKVTTSGREVHDGSMDVEIYESRSQGEFSEEQVQEGMSYLYENVLSSARDYAKEIYKRLEEEYTYQTGPEALKEGAESNGWRFYQDGEFAGSFDDPNAPDPRQTSIDFSK